MNAPRDSYSLIVTHSPWRWVPVFVGPLGFMAMGVAFDTQALSFSNIAAWSAFIVLYLLLRVSRAKDGMADAFRIALEHARASGGRRINSRPWLARILIVLGLVIVLASVVARTATFSADWEGSVVVSMLRSLGFLMPGPMLVLMGFARPWDLQVVERDQVAGDITNRA